MAELGKVTREDVAELDELDAKDRRELWKWIQANQPEKEPEKPKKKKLSKKKAAEARAAEEKATAALTYRKALQIAFRPELPNDAFNVIVTLLFSPKEIFSLTEGKKLYESVRICTELALSSNATQRTKQQQRATFNLHRMRHNAS